MSLTRRTFLELGFKSVAVIGAGNLLQSFAAADFVLPSARKIRLRFALASDGHYGQPKTEYAAMHDDMVRWLNAEKEGRGLDHVIINGDLFHDQLNFLAEVKTKWDGLKMPYYVSHGNHDLADEATWQKTWGTAFQHSFETKEAAFIILNSCSETGTYICPDIAFAAAQFARFQSKKHVFVAMHIAPVQWTENMVDCSALTDLFSRQANLKGIFHGHDHDLDSMKENKGKYHFFDAHVAGSWGTNYRGYRIVEVLHAGEVITYQLNPATHQTINNNRIASVGSVVG